jgi:hypothetical protein
MSEPNNLNPQEQDEKLGVVHENLQGWVPSFASDDEIRAAFEKAFDYRGDLTITLKSGEKIDGYVFDRRGNSQKLSECSVRIMPKDRPDKLSIPYSEIAALAFTGKDTAAGKSFEAWVKKYQAKKAAGEKNIGIDAEPLE